MAKEKNLLSKAEVKGVGDEFRKLNKEGNNFHNILTSIGTRLDKNYELSVKQKEAIQKDLDYTEKLGESKLKISDASVKNLSVEQQLLKNTKGARRDTLLLQQSEIKFLKTAKKLYEQADKVS